jgi:RNA polymerase sigma-70 factor (ECF subfamily)
MDPPVRPPSTRPADLADLAGLAQPPAAAAGPGREPGQGAGAGSDLPGTLRVGGGSAPDPWLFTVGDAREPLAPGSTDGVVGDDGEAQFIARLVARDESAFNELVIMYERRVFGLVYRMLGRRDEAEDLAQEVFVQVFKAIDQFRGDSKLSTWIYRIAVNLCKNRSKYLSRRHAGSQDDVDAMVDRAPLSAAKGVSVGEQSRPDEIVEGMQLERVVKHAIAQLEPEFREVLILRDVEDLSYEEIAAVTGLADGTVKSRIHRARSQLKVLVEKAMGEKLKGGR